MTRTRKIFTGAIAALTLGATVAATATPASAFGYRYGGGWRHGGGWGWGGPAAAGVIGGLALGAIAAGAANAGGYGYGGYGCVANQPVYDNWGNFVGYQRVRVACY